MERETVRETEMSSPLTLGALCAAITRQLSVPSLRDVWVAAELSDVRTSGGHCYMELIEKNGSTGQTIARLRGIIWAGTYMRLAADFLLATGQRLASGMKVLVKGSVNNHAAYGISFIITDIDASYTLGEAERRRREILERLKQNGVLELNRQTPWPVAALRIAVISARGAAGYGDFIHQLYHNESRLRFTTKLFEAVLQGDRTAATVISALDSIASEIENWDCVVIIRGGGATSDLAAFDNYNLALNVAQFPLPVIVGIGHERDITVLDYVANMRVKTPTAAAEWLIARGDGVLTRIRNLAGDISAAASEITAEADKRLAYAESQLQMAATTASERAAARINRSALALAETGTRRISPTFSRLDVMAHSLLSTLENGLTREADRLAAHRTLLAALSPQAIVKRGYTITRANGKAVTSAAQLPPGTTIETILSDGTITSITV